MATPCPFAQLVRITTNYKELQEIPLFALNLQNIPAWYTDMPPPNEMPSLEDNRRIFDESIEVIKLVDRDFAGHSLLPDDLERREFSEELFSRTATFVTTVHSAFTADQQFDSLEEALRKYDGPFFLGQQFSLVDIAYIPFVERFQIFLSEVFMIDIAAGRPKLAAWIEELNTKDAYTQTKTDPRELVEFYRNRFLAQQ